MSESDRAIPNALGAVVDSLPSDVSSPPDVGLDASEYDSVRRVSRIRGYKKPEDRQGMFALFMSSGGDTKYVSRVLGFPEKAVIKACAEEGWWARKDKIEGRAREVQDYDLQKASEQSILMVRAAKAKIAERLKELSPASISVDKLFSEMERIVKLEQMLLGGVTSRTEEIVDSHEGRLKALRDERRKMEIDVTGGLEREQPLKALPEDFDVRSTEEAEGTSPEVPNGNGTDGDT